MEPDKIRGIGMESDKIREIMQRVVRTYREQQSEAQRPFLNEMACFLVQATFLQSPELFCPHAHGTEFEEVIYRCVKLLTLEDCPAIETIQLQVSGQAIMSMESIQLQNEERQHNESLHTVMQNISDIKVYPEFQVVGHLQRKASDELRYLRAHSKTAETIFVHSSEPNFRRTPIGLASLSTDSGLSKLRIIVSNCECLPAQIYTAHCGQADMWSQPSGSENNIDAMNITIIKADDIQNAVVEALELQLNGYCAISVIRNQGLLLQGDPKAGLVRVGEKYFAFSTPHALNEFVKAPISVLRALEMMAIMLPHLVNILGLQHEPCLSHLAIPRGLAACQQANPQHTDNFQPFS